MTKYTNRLHLAAAVTIALGLFSRKYLIPALSGVGDVLWASVLFFLVASLCNRWSTLRVAAISFVIAAAIECSHLLHAYWLEEICKTLPGRLIFGRGFSVSDIVLYAGGIMLAAGVSKMFEPQDSKGAPHSSHLH